MGNNKRKRECEPKSPTTKIQDLPTDSSDSDEDFPVPSDTGGSGAAAVGTEVDRVWESVFPIDSVVKVVCLHLPPNFSMPWQRETKHSSGSSGFVINGKRVLTNAHSVYYYTKVTLKKRGSNTEFLATVLAIGTECDIAMLTVEDEEFWHGLSPVEFGDLPALQDAVTVVGYPHAGDNISVTSGIVSGIEIIPYVHGFTEFLGLQINTAIIPGNSGGPAFNDRGKCVGIGFQTLKCEDEDEYIGHLIPTQIIMHFIHDYEKNGAYTGFPVLGIEWQKMENPDMRMAMGMKSKQEGVRIRRIGPTTREYRVLKPSDVILSIDGIDVANDGTVSFCGGKRINFSYIISKKYIGDSVVIKVLRNSEIYKFDITLGSCKKLIPTYSKGRSPSYYIIAGFVFTTVSVTYLHSEYGERYRSDAPDKLLVKLHSMLKSPDEQLVVISKVLGADINIGYEDMVDIQVLAFNGKLVKNLKSLARMVENCNDEYLEFSLEDDQIVLLRTSTAKAATIDILAMDNVPSAMSDDLKE